MDSRLENPQDSRRPPGHGLRGLARGKFLARLLRPPKEFTVWLSQEPEEFGGPPRQTGVTPAYPPNRLALKAAMLTGEDLIEAVRKARAERLELERQRRSPPGHGLAQQLKALGRECAALPDLDDRTADEIIGYDEFGVPR